MTGRRLTRSTAVSVAVTMNLQRPADPAAPSLRSCRFRSSALGRPRTGSGGQDAPWGAEAGGRSGAEDRAGAPAPARGVEGTGGRPPPT
ncbi:hypothetical protein, partial [Sphaerisporangium fuscum]|uniref:hypothetical protein n=1 Tax=Sphaerisporangium fuscum TaxID=2835868 RepID=UPI001BDD95A9